MPEKRHSYVLHRGTQKDPDADPGSLPPSKIPDPIVQEFEADMRSLFELDTVSALRGGAAAVEQAVLDINADRRFKSLAQQHNVSDRENTFSPHELDKALVDIVAATYCSAPDPRQVVLPDWAVAPAMRCCGFLLPSTQTCEY